MGQGAQVRLLAVLTVVALAFALRASRPVSLPLGLFLIALLWPVQSSFRRWLRPRLAFTATLVFFALCLWAFGWTLAECVDETAERWPRYQPRFEQLVDQWSARAGSWGIDVGTGDGQEAFAWLRRGARTVFAVGGAALLALALTVLGLLEVQQFRGKLERGLSSSSSGRVVESAQKISARFGRYFGARTLMSLIQGVTTALFAWAVGLDLALLWAFSPPCSTTSPRSARCWP